MKSRRALARHVWSMAQTRAEAAGLVLSLQRSALGRGLAWYAVAALAAMALMVGLLLLIAFGTPPEYRSWALGLVSILLFATATYCAIQARQQLTRDAALIADFTTGLRLDLAMVNLALRDPATRDEDKRAAREPDATAVRADAAAVSTPTEMEMPPSLVTPPEEMTAPPPPAQPSHERSTHGTP